MHFQLDKSDICALSRTSKHLYNITVPHLYKHLKIKMPCKNILSGIRDFFEHHDETSAANRLRYVRELYFNADFLDRCPLFESEIKQKTTSGTRLSILLPKSLGSSIKLILGGVTPHHLTHLVYVIFEP